MDILKETIAINSFNCRGLRDSKKQNAVFNWLQSKHQGITILQEKHSVASDEKQWAKEWGGQIYFLHGTSWGVALLIPKNLVGKTKVDNSMHDDDSRLILIECEIEENNILLANIYGPTKDNIGLQLKFLSYLKQLLDAQGAKN